MFLKKFLLFGLIAAILPAFAEEAADRKTATSLKYVTHELETRQNKFGADTNKAMEYTDSAGDVQKRTVKSDLGSDTSDTSLPMVGGVNTKLATKQDDIAAINDHTAVTYTGQSGSIGAKGIYQTTESYVEQSDNLIDAKTFNAALKRGLDSEFLCSEYKPGTDLCWVWSIHNTGPVNLFDKNNPAMRFDGYITNKPVGQETQLAPYNGGDKVLFVKCNPNTTYTVSRKTGLAPAYDRIRVCSFNTQNVPVAENRCIVLVNDMNATQVSATFTTLADTTWCGINVRNSGTPGADWQTYLDNFQFELGANANAYQDHIPTLVPAGYTPLEYIKATGTQYIDTGIAMSNDVEFSGRMGTMQGNVLGIAEDSQGLVVWQSGGHFDFRYIPMDGSSEYTQTTNIPYVTNKLYNVGFNINKTMFTVDGQSVPKTKDIKTVNYTIRTGKYDITASLTIWNNGNKVRDFVPARQNSDNKVGLYDRVNGVFYPNAATSGNDFTAGPDINNIIYIPQNQ